MANNRRPAVSLESAKGSSFVVGGRHTNSPCTWVAAGIAILAVIPLLAHVFRYAESQEPSRFFAILITTFIVAFVAGGLGGLVDGLMRAENARRVGFLSGRGILIATIVYLGASLLVMGIDGGFILSRMTG